MHPFSNPSCERGTLIVRQHLAETSVRWSSWKEAWISKHETSFSYLKGSTLCYRRMINHEVCNLMWQERCLLLVARFAEDRLANSDT